MRSPFEMRSLWLLLGLSLLAVSHVQASTEFSEDLLDEDLDLSDIDENEEEFLRLLEEKNKACGRKSNHKSHLMH